MSFKFANLFKLFSFGLGAGREPKLPIARGFYELRSQLRQTDFGLIYQERNEGPFGPNDLMLFWRPADCLFVQVSRWGDTIGSASLHFCWQGNGTAAVRALPQVHTARTYADGDTWYISGSFTLDSSAACQMSLTELITALKTHGRLLAKWKVPHYFWLSRDGSQNNAKEILGKLGPGTQRAIRGELLPQFRNLHPDGEMV